MEELFEMMMSPMRFECSWRNGELYVRRVGQAPVETDRDCDFGHGAHPPRIGLS
jgi:hypothetical protein